MKKSTFMTVAALLVSVVVIVFIQVNRPYVGSEPTPSDDIRSVAWDAQRRVTALEYDYRSQKWLAFGALCCALWAAFSAYHALGTVQTKRDETVLDMRLRLLEERQGAYVPPATAHSMPQETGQAWEPELERRPRRHAPHPPPRGGGEEWEQEPEPPRASRHAGAPPPPRREVKPPVAPAPMEFPDETPAPAPPPPESRRPVATAPAGGPPAGDTTTPGGEGIVV